MNNKINQNGILNIVNISKSFPGVQALKDVSIDIKKGEVHAICGENGAGKSTLVAILAGVYKPDSGYILLNNKKVEIKNQKHANTLGISMVYQDRSLVPSLNVEENIFAARQPVNFGENIDWKKLYEMTSQLLKSLNLKINPKTLVGDLSPALQQMIEIAKALSLEPDIFILDEPTATVTEREISAIFDIIRNLKKDGKAIIYISHRLAEIFQIADRVSVLKDGAHMGTGDVKNIDQNWIVKKMIGREVYFNFDTRDINENVILECKNFSDIKNFHNINFYLKRHEILSFAGLVGAGRTELFKSLFGATPKTSGDIFFEGEKIIINNPIDAINKGIVYLPEDRKEEGLFLDMNISSNIISACIKSFRKGLDIDNKKVLKASIQYKDKLSIDAPSIEQKVIFLSGGNQQKVILAKWLLVNSKILIIDEPTRGVDVGVKAEIYKILRQLAEEGTSIIIISSDLPEVLSISDRMYVMWNGMITGELLKQVATEEKIMRLASGIELENNLKKEINN